MKTKMIISVFLLLTGIIVHANDALQPGLWKVTQVVIEKNTGKNRQTTKYQSALEVQSYIPCPKEWEIDEQAIVLRYPDGREEIAGYILENDRLTVNSVNDIQTYQYSIKGEVLTLIAVYEYENNLLTGHTEHIVEKWIIILKK